MAKKDLLLALLNQLAGIRQNPDAPDARKTLRHALLKAPALAVARAASVIADTACGGPETEDEGCSAYGIDNTWATDFFPDLEAAFARCCEKPGVVDRGAPAKIAVAVALDRMGSDNVALFERGVSFVQMDPIGDEMVDVAAPLRARCIAALTRLRHPDRMRIALDMLFADQWQDARQGAAQALIYEGTEAAEMTLRAKALVGDPGIPPELSSSGATVMGVVFSGLLAIETQRNTKFVASFLNDEKHTSRSAGRGGSSAGRMSCAGGVADFAGRLGNGENARRRRTRHSWRGY